MLGYNPGGPGTMITVRTTEFLSANRIPKLVSFHDPHCEQPIIVGVGGGAARTAGDRAV